MITGARGGPFGVRPSPFLGHGMEETLVRRGDGADREVEGTGGIRREISPRSILRQLAREHGARGSRKLRDRRLDYRQIGDQAVVYEECPIIMNNLTHGISVLIRVSMPIVAIKPDYGIHDFWRSRRAYQGESSEAAIAKMDEKVRARKQWEHDDMRQAAMSDLGVKGMG